MLKPVIATFALLGAFETFAASKTELEFMSCKVDTTQTIPPSFKNASKQISLFMKREKGKEDANLGSALLENKQGEMRALMPAKYSGTEVLKVAIKESDENVLTLVISRNTDGDLEANLSYPRSTETLKYNCKYVQR